MDKEARFAVLRQALVDGRYYGLQVGEYRSLLGTGCTLSDRTLRQDLHEFREMALDQNLEFLAYQRGNINVALGATNRLKELQEDDPNDGIRKDYTKPIAEDGNQPGGEDGN